MVFWQTKGNVGVGSKAPDFTLPSQSGEMVNLKDFLDRKPVVLFFYPKDDTPECTKEACAFRDDYEQFRKLDAEVVGISSDSVESHRGFTKKHGLPFTLLSDEGGKVRRLYDVPNTFGLFPGRVTYGYRREGRNQARFLLPTRYEEACGRSLKDSPLHRLLPRRPGP
jgi:peroxiredoxin Q/BCP